MARFGAVVTAMVTPFDDDGRLDLDAAAGVARYLADRGSDGLVVAGSTGESTVLTDGEKIDLWRATAEAATIPVLAGTGSADPAHAVELTRQATACGVAGILAVSPYYNRPPQAGIRSYFEAIAAATHLPVMLYDIPARTGRKVAHDTVVRLAAEVANVVAIKDAGGDPAASAKLMADAPPGFEVYSGDDALTLPLLAVGAVGVVGVATHWTASMVGEMIMAFEKGDVAAARQINARMLESYAFESTEEAPNPIPAKAVMRVLGQPVGQCRPPLGPAPAGLEDRAREVLAGLG